MDTIEQAVRDAAEQLQTAVDAAVAGGYHILWPRPGEDITMIALSATGKMSDFIESGALAENEMRSYSAPASGEASTVTNLDGSPIARDADGLIHGEPLALTDEERAALPPLGEADLNSPPIMAFGTLKGAPDAV